MIDLTDEQLSPAPAGRSRGRLVALAIAVVVVVVAGAFAAVSLAGSDNAPADPVRAMLNAAQRGDAIGVLEQLDPGERDAVRGPLTDLVKELNRLGVLQDASLSKVPGVQLKISDLSLSATKVRDGLQRVRIDRGTSTYSVDLNQLPLGKFVRDLAGDNLKDAKSSGTSDLSAKAGNDFVAVVQRSGRWYVSLNYTAGETAREDRHLALGDMGDPVPAAGAASPQDAVRDLITAAVNLDVRRVVELMPPDELPALHDYAGMFMDQAKKATDQAKQSYTVAIPTLDLDARTSGDHSLVTVKKAELSIKSDSFSLTYKDGCADLTMSTSASVGPQHVCAGANPTDVFKSFGVGGDLKPPDFSFTGKKPAVGFVAVKQGGKWYVSPTRTVLEDLVTTLKIVQPSDLEKGRDWVSQLMDTFSSRGFGGTSTDGAGCTTLTTTPGGVSGVCPGGGTLDNGTATDG